MAEKLNNTPVDRNQNSAENPSPPYKRSRNDDENLRRTGDSRMTRFCDLPEKAVMEIMSWLPPKYLFRLKSVQKSWYALISTLLKSQWFVEKHLKNSESSPCIFLRSSTYSFGARPHNKETINSFMTFN